MQAGIYFINEQYPAIINYIQYRKNKIQQAKGPSTLGCQAEKKLFVTFSLMAEGDFRSFGLKFKLNLFGARKFLTDYILKSLYNSLEFGWRRFLFNAGRLYTDVCMFKE